MRLIHLADLHIDKKVFGYSMADLQRDVLGQVLDLAEQRAVDGVLIAGDVYDTAVPNVEGVGILDWFLSRLHEMNIPVFMISGNHDSAGRLQFASKMLEQAGVFIAGRYQGSVPFADLEKEGERVRIHLLPFIKPAMIRAVHENDCRDWTEAVRIALSKAELIVGGKNILVSHQFYAGAAPCESEQLIMGNLDQVDCAVLEPFDYAALGHLHNPQHVRCEKFRYPGTLLKFSASELNVKKTITLIDTSGPQIAIEEIPVRPARDFVRVSGTYEQLMNQDTVRRINPENYVYICLEDETELPNVLERLQTRYPRILKIEYLKKLPENQLEEDWSAMRSEMKNHEQILQEFYQRQNGTPLDETMKTMLEECWEAIHETD